MSRKIEQQMIAAIRAGKNWQSGNTSVAQEADGTYVFLHGNLIVRNANGNVQWTLAGWNTPTTRSRINALAAAFNWKRVFCESGAPYARRLDGSTFPISSTEWVDALA